VADDDLTIVILRNVQSSLGEVEHSLGEVERSLGELRGEVGELRGEVGELRGEVRDLGHRVDRVEVGIEGAEKRLTYRMDRLEQTTIKIADQLGIETRSSRQRLIRHEGELAELDSRVSDLEAIVKPKPSS
jgi:chromosome segregation ATPase